jgi:diaminohydroxyphosphoribosylaminopyrimidine deaminase/5-amino-6-(5-phosphoribosylamino)uracil reductase
MRRPRQPWRVVLTRSGQLPRHARVLSDKFAARTLIYKRKSLASVLKDLGKRGITCVLIEGGGEVLGEALEKRLIDKAQIYLGPILTGGPVVAFPGEGVEKTADALRLRDIEYQQIGQTISFSGYPDIQASE